MTRHAADHRPRARPTSRPRPFADRHIGPSADDERAHARPVLGHADDSTRSSTAPCPPRSGWTGRCALEPGRTEHEVLAELRELAARNTVLTSMIGLGYYGTHTPAVIRRNVLESPAWYTAYTPYQPEI